VVGTSTACSGIVARNHTTHPYNVSLCTPRYPVHQIVTVEQIVQLFFVQVLHFILNPVASLSNMLVVVLLHFFSKVPG